MTLQRTPNGGFVLQPGYYEMQTQSYCLKAGTHGPGGGDGYLYAPPKGPAEDAVMTIVRNSVNRPEIPQHKIQQLLWAIIARAKFEDLQAEIKATASQLLTPRQLASLNRSALDVLSGNALTDALGGVPAPLRQVAQAEAQLRQMLTTPGATFAEMERVAVLSGAAPLGAGQPATCPSGRWSLHPDGYYVRYLPSGYSSTRVEIWVPQGSPVGRQGVRPGHAHRRPRQHRAPAAHPVGPRATAALARRDTFRPRGLFKKRRGRQLRGGARRTNSRPHSWGRLLRFSPARASRPAVTLERLAIGRDRRGGVQVSTA